MLDNNNNNDDNANIYLNYLFAQDKLYWTRDTRFQKSNLYVCTKE